MAEGEVCRARSQDRNGHAAPVGETVPMILKSHWWWDLTTQDFAGLDPERVVAILPVAAVEQHGPHLPVRVDAAINAGIMARAVELMPSDCPALVLPMMPFGKSDEHLAFPGTLTLSYETLGRVWYELGESVHRAGLRKILFLNSHGGQPQLLEIVCRDLRVKLGMFASSVMWPRLIDMDDLYPAAENRHGIHGGQSETSVMLHLHPDLVDMNSAENFVPLSAGVPIPAPVDGGTSRPTAVRAGHVTQPSAERRQSAPRSSGGVFVRGRGAAGPENLDDEDVVDLVGFPVEQHHEIIGVLGRNPKRFCRCKLGDAECHATIPFRFVKTRQRPCLSQSATTDSG